MTEFRTELRKFSECLDIDEAKAQDWLKKSSEFSEITKIPGDASTRRYYRAKKTDGQSYILMKMDSFADQAANLPFLSIQKYLKGVGVPVPEVLDFDPPLGHILLEDLGDVTLLRRLQNVAETENERYFYEKVIDALVEMHVKATPQNKAGAVVPQLEAFQLVFDFEKLFWEIGFTIENFYELYLKRTLKPEDRKILTEGFTEICQVLAAQPRVFTHRDFHSRNIMVNAKDQLIMIDFQDARMGPQQYDLVSLLRDSYYQLEEAQVVRLTDYYVARWEAQSGQQVHRKEFDRIFDLMALQRNFKAIGSFASFFNKRGNPTYLKYIGNTFENIRHTLLKYPEYSPLREVLFHYYYF